MIVKHVQMYVYTAESCAHAVPPFRKEQRSVSCFCDILQNLHMYVCMHCGLCLCVYTTCLTPLVDLCVNKEVSVGTDVSWLTSVLRTWFVTRLHILPTSVWYTDLFFLISFTSTHWHTFNYYCSIPGMMNQPSCTESQGESAIGQLAPTFL